MLRKLLLVLVILALVSSAAFGDVCTAVLKPLGNVYVASVDFGSGNTSQIDKLKGVTDFLVDMEAKGWKVEHFSATALDRGLYIWFLILRK